MDLVKKTNSSSVITPKSGGPILAVSAPPDPGVAIRLSGLTKVHRAPGMRIVVADGITAAFPAASR